MGKRSRRRAGVPSVTGAPVVTDAVRGEHSTGIRDGGGADAKSGPPAPPWGSFPLTELAVFTCLILIVLGFVLGGMPGTVLLATGLVIGSASGFEQALREHRGGYKSHAAVLAGIPGAVTVAVLAVVGVAPVVFAPVGLAVAIAVWLPVRSSFVQR